MSSKYMLALLIGTASSHKLITNHKSFPGSFEAERDTSAGYPSSNAILGHSGFVKEFIGKDGQMLTDHEADLNAEAKQEADLKEASEKTMWEVPPRMINDWTGEHFVKNTYGWPYEAKNV